MNRHWQMSKIEWWSLFRRHSRNRFNGDRRFRDQGEQKGNLRMRSPNTVDPTQSHLEFEVRRLRVQGVQNPDLWLWFVAIRSLEFGDEVRSTSEKPKREMRTRKVSGSLTFEKKRSLLNPMAIIQWWRSSHSSIQWWRLVQKIEFRELMHFRVWRLSVKGSKEQKKRNANCD